MTTAASMLTEKAAWWESHGADVRSVLCEVWYLDIAVLHVYIAAAMVILVFKSFKNCQALCNRTSLTSAPSPSPGVRDGLR